jgi:hypothetical protein
MIKGENDYLVMEQIVKGRISPPQTRRPSLPDALSDIIMRALTPDRERRYATADELRVALDQFAASASLTAASSTIAAYMRQQFGQRPEPWLELDKHASAAVDVPRTTEGSMPSNSWNEVPRSASDRRRTHTVPAHSGPLAVIANDGAADATARMTAPAQASPLSSSSMSSSSGLSSSGLSSSGLSSSGLSLANTPPPTNSRLGWESQPRPTARTFPVQKVAIASGAVLAGIAIWIIAAYMTRSSAPIQTAALTAPPPAPPVAVVAPPPAPLPVAPPDASVPTEAVAAAAAPSRSSRDPETAPMRKTRAAAAATRAPGRASAEIAPPPAPKNERPIRVATVAQTEPPGRVDAGVTESEPHRPAAAPQLPPLAATSPVAPTTAAVPPPVAAPTPATPTVVAPAALDANRIAGDKSIVPDETTMDAISRSGADKLTSSFKVCVNAEGAIATVSQLKSSGFPQYDEKIQNTIRKEWRYKPYLVNGKATPVCTAFRFIYSQK